MLSAKSPIHLARKPPNSLRSSKTLVVSLAVLVLRVLLERRPLLRRLPVLPAHLADDGLCRDVLNKEMSRKFGLHGTKGVVKGGVFVGMVGKGGEGKIWFTKKEGGGGGRKTSYRLQLRLCGAGAVFGVAVALLLCFGAVAHFWSSFAVGGGSGGRFDLVKIVLGRWKGLGW